MNSGTQEDTMQTTEFGLFKPDEQIMRCFFRLMEYREQRLRLERMFHPEKFAWKKRGAPPEMSWSTKLKLAELNRIGMGESLYEAYLTNEANERQNLCDLAIEHPLWEHFDRIKGLGPYLCGAFIAAGGDIQRAPKVQNFWRGVGLDVLAKCGSCGHHSKSHGPNTPCAVPKCKCEAFVGTVPRKMRGTGDKTCGTCYHKEREHNGGVCSGVTHLPDGEQLPCECERFWERLVPAMPYIPYVGEQIRDQILRTSTSKLHALYREFRAQEDDAHPTKQKMFKHKGALRKTQKLLYACLWREWRRAYGLPAPEPYAFEILRHNRNSLLRIEDLYDD